MGENWDADTGWRRQRGFTLLEIAVVIGIMALLVSATVGVLPNIVNQQRAKTTQARLERIETALYLFVTRTQRLPCPAAGDQPDSNLASATEQPAGSGCANAQKTGVLPWATLGLSAEDGLDGWGHRFTYRIDPVLQGNAALNMSQCDPVGTGPLGPSQSCLAACLSSAPSTCTKPNDFLNGKGLEVRDAANNVLMTRNTAPYGAAYVVISHGSNGTGAFDVSGSLQQSSGVEGTREAVNKNNQALTGASTFVSSLPIDAKDATYFDDFVLYRGVLEVANRAGLGPRSHP